DRAAGRGLSPRSRLPRADRRASRRARADARCLQGRASRRIGIGGDMRRIVPLALAALAFAHVATAAGLLQAGDTFPDWRLPDHTGAMVAAKDLAGKTYLIWFYPRAQTPGCTAEGRGLRDRVDDFRARGVEIVGVSFDAPDANAAFVKAESFPF